MPSLIITQNAQLTIKFDPLGSSLESIGDFLSVLSIVMGLVEVYTSWLGYLKKITTQTLNKNNRTYILRKIQLFNVRFKWLLLPSKNFRWSFQTCNFFLVLFYYFGVVVACNSLCWRRILWCKSNNECLESKGSAIQWIQFVSNLVIRRLFCFRSQQHWSRLAGDWLSFSFSCRKIKTQNHIFIIFQIGSTK